MTQIIWHCLPNESEGERIDRLNEQLHRIFFDGKAVCPKSHLDDYIDRHVECRICGEVSPYPDHETFKHCTPRFLQSLDAMQLIVESGKFAEVREEYFHWAPFPGAKYLCRVLLYRNENPCMDYSFQGASYNSRQEAFYVAALKSLGYL